MSGSLEHQAVGRQWAKAELAKAQAEVDLASLRARIETNELRLNGLRSELLHHARQVEAANRICEERQRASDEQIRRAIQRLQVSACHWMPSLLRSAGSRFPTRIQEQLYDPAIEEIILEDLI